MSDDDRNGAHDPVVAHPDAARWSDAALLDLLRAHAPAGVRPESMLPVVREVAATGVDPRSLIAAAQGSPSMPSPSPELGATLPPLPPVAPGEPRTSPWRRRGRMALIVVFWLAVWEVADRLVDNRLILTGPIRTAQELVVQAVDPDFWLISGASFARIAVGFVAAFLAGILLALVAHRFALVRDVLAPAMSVLRTVPMVAFIIMLLIWVGSQILTVWLAFLIVMPLIYTSMSAGLGAVDPRTREMARAYRVSAGKRFWYFDRPVFMPFVVSAARIGLGMSWKAGIMAEVFATPSLSIGKEMFVAKTFLDTPALFAWTVVVMLLSLVFERAVLVLLRWLSSPFGGWLGRR